MRIKSQATFKVIRVQQGFSITGLAKAMQVSPSVVFNIEKGKNIRPATARRACEVLGEEFKTLFTIEDSQVDAVKQEGVGPRYGK